MIISAPAKINLALDVIARRPDGYHQVDMVMQTIELADFLTLEPAVKIELNCNMPGVPLDERNLAWRAARLIQEISGVSKGVKINISKKIPVAAGLAGGSADAAAVLIGVNNLWELGLSKSELMELGVRLGADVPFCIMRGTARARGIGEELTPVKTALKSKVLLVTPKVPIATGLIYQKLKVDEIRDHPNIPGVVTALEIGDLKRLFDIWGNVLETVVLKENPLVLQVKDYFKRFGLNYTLMSGSGPTVFTLDPPPEIVEPFLGGLPLEWFGCLTEFLNQ
ncbi:MAG: 4-(cytidine 5'-diphospho)-2-C-methyl-D-erythritol kinase [Firmicutes bacterium]|nr:4-(cytidine 5'-diphospho)-2-C-methyl-D-erythritol kinase [Bacillota bacterium]